MPDNADDAKSDVETIGRDAVNEHERRLALDYCLSQCWPNEEIAQLVRRDNGWHGWEMWRKS